MTRRSPSPKYRKQIDKGVPHRLIYKEEGLMRIKTTMLLANIVLSVNFFAISSASAQRLADRPRGTSYTIIIECKALAGEQYSRQSNQTIKLDGIDNFYKIEKNKIYNWDFQSQAWTYILGADYFISESVFLISDGPGPYGLIQYKAEINRSSGLFLVKRLRTLPFGSEYVSETWQGKCNRSQEPIRASRVRPQ